MNLKEIKEIISLMNDNDLTEVELEREGNKIKLKKGAFEGKQVDWGGWVAKVKKEEIIKFLNEIYDKEWFLKNKERIYVLQNLDKLKEYVNTLDPIKQYALVAMEH